MTNIMAFKWQIDADLFLNLKKRQDVFSCEMYFLIPRLNQCTVLNLRMYESNQ